MAWKGRIEIELQNMTSLTIKDNGIMYIPTDDKQVGYGLIKGDLGTPYANGFYLIKVIIPPEYPFKPPTCQHVSMSGARQSPNFHDYGGDSDQSGTVCLSRLNTWEGSAPGKDRWTPAMNIAAVLDMIRMQVLTPNALDNEPNYRHSIENPVNTRNYDEFVRYHNFRSNVVDIYSNLRNAKCNIPCMIQCTFADAVHAYVTCNLSWYKKTLDTLLLRNAGIYVTCSTYTNSSCFCDYDEVRKAFNAAFDDRN
jgi:ubiquitin-protein ligase